MKAKILYVEDDPYLSYVTQDNLELQGYEIVCCENGEDALECFHSGDFNLCILDIMLPKMDGFTLAENIRKKNQDIPILFLSAKSLKEDRIKGLRLGADDYIVKPFSIEELVLRIEVFLKRSKVRTQTKTKPIQKFGEYMFNSDNLQLHYKDSSLKLTKREAELLSYFLTHRNKVLDRDDILRNVWGADSYFVGRSLDVFISRLRKYFKDDDTVCIRNVHGHGFIFETHE